MTILSVLPVLTEGTTLRVTSPFGYRTDPVTGEDGQGHKGIDLTLWRGYSALSAIGAAWDGTVTDVRDGVEGFDTVRSAGNRVTIDHGDGVVTKYYHLANGSIPVQVGDSVAAGHIIGQMGSTGYSTGAHLHFQLEIYGEPVPIRFEDRMYLAPACPDAYLTQLYRNYMELPPEGQRENRHQIIAVDFGEE